MKNSGARILNKLKYFILLRTSIFSARHVEKKYVKTTSKYSTIPHQIEIFASFCLRLY